MSWSGGGLYPPWGGLAPPNYRQPSSNQDQLRREAARRRHAEAANSLAEQRRKAGAINDGEDLFSGPRKTDGHTDVERVLGPIEDAHKIINKTSCFGVDYQPPTPAPAQHHLIGEEDEEDVKVPGATKKLLGPPNPRPLRPPSSTKQPARPPVSKAWPPGQMAPPKPMAPPPPSKPQKPPGTSQSQNSKSAPAAKPPRLSPLKMPSNEKKPSIPSDNSIEDEDIKAIFQEMKHPYQGDLGGLPTPLTGIETPRVDIEDRGEQRHKPRYPGRSSNPFQYTDEAKQVPSSPKRETQPLEEPQKTIMSKPSVSKDTSSSSSSSDSDSNEPFDIRSLINRNKPTPSPRQPTSSPGYSPVKTEKQHSPLSGLGRPPKILSPVRDLSSPPHIREKSDTENSHQKKRKDSGKVKPPKTHKTSKPCSDDEDVAGKKRQRSPKKKPVKSSVSAEKSKKKSFMDDSDSEPEKPSSQSPAKFSAAQKQKKPSLPAQSNGGGGGGSGSGMKRSSKSSSNLPSKNQPKHRKSEPVRQTLSDSEEEEEPVGPSDKKRKIFSNIFGIGGV